MASLEDKAHFWIIVVILAFPCLVAIYTMNVLAESTDLLKVIESETVSFPINTQTDRSVQITRHQSYQNFPDCSKKIRLWYKTEDGSTTGGKDYVKAESNWIAGQRSTAITIKVETFEDDMMEEDEAFSIRMKNRNLMIFTVDCSMPTRLLCSNNRRLILVGLDT